MLKEAYKESQEYVLIQEESVLYSFFGMHFANTRSFQQN